MSLTKPHRDEDHEPSRCYVTCSWDEVPHLSEKEKREMLDGVQPHLRDARSKGIPAMGSGAIYDIPLDEVSFQPGDILPMPDYWPRGYGLDIGYAHPTAAVWGTWDRDSDIVYLYSEHYRNRAELAVHAAAIKMRGDWIRGAADPSSGNATQIDGRRAISEYTKLGLRLVPADNAVNAGIDAVYERLVSGRLKISTTLTSLRTEYRSYRRDEDGKIVKELDDALDAVRYLIMELGRVMRVKPTGKRDKKFASINYGI